MDNKVSRPNLMTTKITFPLLWLLFKMLEYSNPETANGQVSRVKGGAMHVSIITHQFVQDPGSSNEDRFLRMLMPGVMNTIAQCIGVSVQASQCLCRPTRPHWPPNGLVICMSFSACGLLKQVEPQDSPVGLFLIGRLVPSPTSS